MKISNIQFGEFEVDENKIIEFKEGIIGFDTLNQYVFISLNDNLFYWLTAIGDPEITFPLIPIRIFYENYPKIDNYEPFGIVKLSSDALKITVNLKSPVYINVTEKKGFQKIIDNDVYPLDYQVFVEK